MQSIDIEIINKLGLHARAASKLIAISSRYACSIHIISGDKRMDAKSIMSVMMLAASKGTWVTIETDGTDEQQAIDSMCLLINNKFDEEE